MAQVVYRANLSAASFPFISTFGGRTVIVPGQDNTFNRQVQSSNDLDKDVGIPQIYYCHNVLPNGNGFQSVGYEEKIHPTDDSGLSQMLKVRDDSYNGGSKAYLALAASSFYLCTDETLGYTAELTQYWNGSTLVDLPTDLQSRQITIAHVSGISYIYIESLYCLVFSFSNLRLELTTLTSLTATAILGLTESNGYLVAYSSNAVAWSSTIDPTDFTPSLQTGAGGGNVEGIQGVITAAAPTSVGFTVYTAANAVSVLYTGNSRYPFQFSPCQGSGGVESLERVAFEADIGYNYAYTTKGFQILRAKTSDTVFPDMTDFIAGQYFEDFDDTTLTFSYNNLLVPMQKKIVLISARYLVVSYGIDSLTHALVYDTVQKRFGKLKVDHTDCFEYDLLSETVSDVPKKSIAFLQTDGRVVVVNFAVGFANRNGTIILGKYQYVRSKLLQLQEAEFENPAIDGSFTVNCFTSYDGKNTDEVNTGFVLHSGANISAYGFGSPQGINHSFCCQGAFNLTTVELKFNPTSSI